MRWLLLVVVSLSFVGVARADVSRPWIGIALEKGAAGGVRVKQVIDDTPGARAGLRAGDEVTAIDKDAVGTPQQLIETVAKKGIGAKVSVALLRDGKAMTFSLTLEAKPEAMAIVKKKLLNKPAPPFALDGFGPFAARTKELAGHVVVVEFWATWCGFCQQTRPAVATWQKNYKDLRVVAIAPDDLDDLKKVATEEQLPFTVAHDTDQRAQVDYFVPGLPTFVVIDKAGIVRYVGVGAGDGFDGVEPAFKKLL